MDLTPYTLTTFNRATLKPLSEINNTWFLFHVEKDGNQFFILHFGPGNMSRQGKRTLVNNTSIIIENENNDTIFGLPHMKYKLHNGAGLNITNDYTIISFLIGIQNILLFCMKNKLIFSPHNDSDLNPRENCLALINDMKDNKKIIFLNTTHHVFPDSGTCLLYRRTYLPHSVIQEKFHIVLGWTINGDVVSCESLSLLWFHGVMCKYEEKITFPLKEIIYYQNENLDELMKHLFKGKQCVSIFDHDIQKKMGNSLLKPFYYILLSSSEDKKVSEELEQIEESERLEEIERLKQIESTMPPPPPPPPPPAAAAASDTAFVPIKQEKSKLPIKHSDETEKVVELIESGSGGGGPVSSSMISKQPSIDAEPAVPEEKHMQTSLQSTASLQPITASLQHNTKLDKTVWNKVITDTKLERRKNKKPLQPGDQLFVLYNPQDNKYLPFSKDQVGQLELKILEPMEKRNTELKKARDEYIKERNDAEWFIKDALKKWTKKVYDKRTNYQNTKRKILKPPQTSTTPSYGRLTANFFNQRIFGKIEGGRKTHKKQKTQKIRITKKDKANTLISSNINPPK
jgi:hypothetical protein